jgi:hypothetical protein
VTGERVVTFLPRDYKRHERFKVLPRSFQTGRSSACEHNWETCFESDIQTCKEMEITRTITKLSLHLHETFNGWWTNKSSGCGLLLTRVFVITKPQRNPKCRLFLNGKRDYDDRLIVIDKIDSFKRHMVDFGTTSQTLVVTLWAKKTCFDWNLLKLERFWFP